MKFTISLIWCLTRIYYCLIINQVFIGEFRLQNKKKKNIYLGTIKFFSIFKYKDVTVHSLIILSSLSKTSYAYIPRMCAALAFLPLKTIIVFNQLPKTALSRDYFIHYFFSTGEQMFLQNSRTLWVVTVLIQQLIVY